MGKSACRGNARTRLRIPTTHIKASHIAQKSVIPAAEPREFLEAGQLVEMQQKNKTNKQTRPCLKPSEKPGPVPKAVLRAQACCGTCMPIQMYAHHVPTALSVCLSHLALLEYSPPYLRTIPLELATHWELAL